MKHKVINAPEAIWLNYGDGPEDEVTDHRACDDVGWTSGGAATDTNVRYVRADLHESALAQSRAEAEATLRGMVPRWIPAPKHKFDQGDQWDIGYPHHVVGGQEFMLAVQMPLPGANQSHQAAESAVDALAGDILGLDSDAIDADLKAMSQQAATPECGCGMPPNMRVCLGPHNDAPMDHQAATQDPAPTDRCYLHYLLIPSGANCPLCAAQDPAPGVGENKP